MQTHNVSLYIMEFMDSLCHVKAQTFLPSFCRNMVDTRFAPVLVPAAEMILDIYKSVIGESPVVDRQLLRIQELLEKEITYQQDLLEVLGMLDTMFASSLPKKEVPCFGISRPNGEANVSRPQLQVT